MSLPHDAKERKALPMARGLLDYFPDALAAVANVSRVGNEQHNPGQPIHWAKHLSTDHSDCLLRHLVDRGRRDSDGLRHSAKVAWRALALLQMELEAEQYGVNAEEYIRRLQAAEKEPRREEADWIMLHGMGFPKPAEIDVVAPQPCECGERCHADQLGHPAVKGRYYCRKGQDQRIPCRCDHGCSYNHKNFDRYNYRCCEGEGL